MFQPVDMEKGIMSSLAFITLSKLVANILCLQFLQCFRFFVFLSFI